MRLLRIARRALPVLFLTTAFATALAVSLLGTRAALAQAPPCIEWAAAVDGDFADDTKWTGGLAPAAADDACITVGGAAYTVTLSAGRTVNAVLIGADGELAVLAPVLGSQTVLTVPGGVINQFGTAADDTIVAALSGRRSQVLGLAGDDDLSTVDGDGSDVTSDTQGANTCAEDINDNTTCT